MPQDTDDILHEVTNKEYAYGFVTAIESDKAPKRSLFNGLAQVILQSTKKAGEIQIEATKDGWDGPALTPAKLVITTKQVETRPAVPFVGKA